MATMADSRRHRRGQSMMAQQFSAQLDDLFKIDNGLDSMVHDVEQKRQSVFFQTRELEELQERIRAAEARLGRNDDNSTEASSSSAPARQRSHSTQQPSVFAIAETDKEEEEVPRPTPVARGPGTQTPQSTASNEYVVVRRPRPGAKKNPRVDSHMESEESEEEEDDEVSEEEESSEEEEDEMESSSDEE